MSVYIVSTSRTPMGSFQGSLSSLNYVDLGSHAVTSAINKINLPVDEVDEIIFGCALSANVGQDPARQVALKSGLPESIVSTTVNKVCASGMKSIILGYQTILTGSSDVVVVGGAESMSNAPYYVPRTPLRYGNSVLIDGLQNDGLKDAYDGFLMGMAGEKLANDRGYSRDQIDDYAIKSYEKAFRAFELGKFNDEIDTIEIKKKSGTTFLTKDEDLGKFNELKLRNAKPVFTADGTITAPNAPSLNDGGAALILVSESKLKSLGLTPLCKIVSFGESAVKPIDFTIAPSKALPKALSRAKLNIHEIDFFEFNEAFSTVGLANTEILGINPDQVNVYGGAVGLGHPLGCSGARIVTTLISILIQEHGKLGAAAICNGGGGASSIIIERT